ncbi:MAG: ZIP family metal transporter [Bacilli bacterium]|nr:ZIP family metal transporter [Bacilli bacterium]
MISISIFDLFPESIKLFKLNYNLFISILLFLIFFILGSLIIVIINKIIPQNNNLYKIGIISMIGIMLHNIPEGILTFVTSSINKKLGLSMAMAISMHNIPEGISISIPIYYSTKSKIKAVFYCFISALSEVFGALITYIFLYNYINDIFIASILSLVCGIMSYISLFELIPEILSYKNKKLFYIFFIVGVIFMLINVIL